jgi:putative colanic acid biosynthesis acetyltransferase WcaF
LSRYPVQNIAAIPGRGISMRHDNFPSGSDAAALDSNAASVLKVSLRDFDNSLFRRGRPILVEAMWMVASALFVESRIPGSMHRRLLLRLFGARIGKRVAIKPGVRIKFPWRLSIGSDSWIGEDVWIDNLDRVKIGNNCCLSQGAYICTGSHDWSSPRFDLITKPVTIGDCAWIAARTTVAPGVVAMEGAILAMASVATANLDPWSIYQGVPAKFIKPRTVRGAG